MNCKRYYDKIRLGVVAIAATLAAVGCSDTWDNHYDAASTGDGSTIWSAISQNSNLSNFASVLKATGYDEILSGSQVFTVFAPTNDALSASEAQAYIDLYNQYKSAGYKDEDNYTLKTFIKNHIALYNTSVSSYTNDSITMMNGKYETLTSSAVGGAAFTSQNALYSNGILYTVSSLVPYNNNIFEAIQSTEGLDSLSNFLYSYNVYEFDESQSVAGEIVDGKTVYLDSVTELTNKMLNAIGYIDREDSTYWMVAPTNDVWSRLYSQYEQYYNYDNSTSKRDSLIRVNTALSIIGGTVFSMNTQGSLQDSANSTNWTKRNYEYYKYLHPFAEGGVFNGTTNYTCSNGQLMVANQWNIDPHLTFLRQIKVEGEATRYQKEIANANEPLVVRTVPTNNPFYGKVSGNSFAVVEPVTSSSHPEVTYDIPNVLSNTPYDIYIVFAPAIAYDTLATADSRKPCKVRVTLGYNRQNGNVTTKALKAEDGGNLFYTQANVVDTVLVGSSIEIPTCSYGLDEEQCYLRIVSYVKGEETAEYQKTMRIDCIIFKPHEE